MCSLTIDDSINSSSSDNQTLLSNGNLTDRLDITNDSSGFVELSSTSFDNNKEDGEEPTNHITRQQPNYDIGSDQTSRRKKQIYTYRTDWLVSCVAWATEGENSLLLAASSFIEDYHNKISFIRLDKSDENDQDITNLFELEHSYPATKVQWASRGLAVDRGRMPKLVATTADYLRIWSVEDELASDSPHQAKDRNKHAQFDVKLECLLNANQGKKHCAPLTSMDWNESDPNLIVTSSVDSNCTVWDVSVGKVIDETQNSARLSTGSIRHSIVAQKEEVYDVSFSLSGSGRDVFASVGGDGSVRLFDLRNLSFATQLYQRGSISNGDNLNNQDLNSSKALVRVACNKQNSHHIAAFGSNSSQLLILDIRSPGRPVVTLSCHKESINSMCWASNSADYITSVSDDQQTLIWKISDPPEVTQDPLFAYRAGGKINGVSWSSCDPNWIAIGYRNCIEFLRV